MGKWITYGMEDFLHEVEDINEHFAWFCGHTIYEGANEFANEMRRQIEAIPGRRGPKPFTGLTLTQKEGLASGLGISHAFTSYDGVRSVTIGFNGYNNLRTDTYRKGQPNVLIARCLVGGTEWQAQYDFVTKATRKAKPKVESIMKDTFEKELAKYKK